MSDDTIGIMAAILLGQQQEDWTPANTDKCVQWARRIEGTLVRFKAEDEAIIRSLQGDSGPRSDEIKPTVGKEFDAIEAEVTLKRHQRGVVRIRGVILYLNKERVLGDKGDSRQGVILAAANTLSDILRINFSEKGGA